MTTNQKESDKGFASPIINGSLARRPLMTPDQVRILWRVIIHFNLLAVYIKQQEEADLENRRNMRIKKILNISKAASLVSLGMFDPFFGAVGFLGLRLLERGQETQTIREFFSQRWENMDPSTRDKIQIAAILTTGISIVLITSMLIPKNETRGGIPSLVPPGFTRLVGKTIDLDVLVSEKFCPLIAEYVKTVGFSTDFRIPKDYANTKLLLETILYLNRKILGNEGISFINEKMLYFLSLLCTRDL